MIRFEQPLLATFKKVEVRSDDLDLAGRFTRQLAVLNGVMTYRLRHRSSLQLSREDILSLQAVRREGSLVPSYNIDHHGTNIEIIGNGQPHLYCFVAMLSGGIEMTEGPNGTALAHGTSGLILRGSPGTRLVTSDNSARMSLWVPAERLEAALEGRLGEPPRKGKSLSFSSRVDWGGGAASAVWRLMAHLVEELRDPKGLTTDPIALETFTELLVQVIIHRLEHNYSARLDRPVGVAIPAHLRRAEAFMHASADKPIRLSDVAAAAGCSAGALRAAFRQFRSTTPLAALHDIRLESAHAALLAADDDEPTRAIARRYGFTNPSRFIAAYGRRFGEPPNETRRRGIG